MSTGASYDTKQRVKQAVDIVDLVESYLPLRREGRLFKALCPWHDDTRPSLQVNPERQSFRCWVCDVGGDIFSFVMKIEGVGFPEALAMLADRANIPLQTSQRGTPGPVDDKRVLYQAMAWADGQYHECLLGDPEAAAARRYLSERRISNESVRRFQLGYAPTRREWLLERSRGTPYSAAVLEKVDLVSRRRQGPGYYDRFQGRVLFPIFDAQGRAVGLGGRVLPGAASAETAKYINSRETPLFRKSDLLYGLNLARDAVRKSSTALVTEGYTDCIACHQAGFDNAVAVLGTALGWSHVQQLRRLAERVRVVLVLDGDEAGRRRAKEVLELFVAGNVDLRVLTLPDELDPAEFLESHGAKALSQLVDEAPDALSHAFRMATAGLDLKRDLHASGQALEQLAATIAKAPRLRGDTTVEDRLREERFLQRLAADFQVSESQVRELVTARRRKGATRATPAAVATPASTPARLEALERELLEILVLRPESIERIRAGLDPAQLNSPPCRQVVERSLQLWSEGILPDFARLLLEFDDPLVKNLLVELDENGRRKPEAEIEARLQDVLTGYERRQREHRLQAPAAALKLGQLAEEEQLAVLLQLEQHHLARQQEQQARARLGTSNPTDG